jgi:4a-hydroxytetrahydrobiopterin dehydratase
MATLLEDAAIETALASLPGWRREENRLVKDVEVSDDSAEALQDAVGKVADELDHHPLVDRSPGSLRFHLWSHSAGGITQKDVELAARIDQVISGSAQGPAR